jgi:hypothetical protein
MTYRDEDDVFARFAEERRELGFQRDLVNMQRKSARRGPWLAVCAILLIAAAGVIVMTSSQAEQDHVTTTSLH